MLKGVTLGVTIKIKDGEKYGNFKNYIHDFKSSVLT